MKRQSKIAILLIIITIIVIDIIYFANQTVTLNFYSHPDLNGSLRESIAKFESNYPKVRINLIELPDNTNDKFELLSSKLALKDGSVDIIDSDVTWPAIYVKNGWIEQLDSHFSSKELSEHFISSVDAARIDNKLYGIPYRFDSGLIFYRTDLIEKYGFKTPSTLNELIAISKVITSKEKNLYGYAGSWKNFEGLTCNYLELLWACNGDLHADPKNAQILQIDEKQGYEALKMMIDLIYKDKLTPLEATNYSSGDARQLFAEGKLLFLRDWPAGWAVINAPESKVRNFVGAMPIFKHNEQEISPGTYGGWQYMISKHSKHKSAAVKFIKFMTSDEEQKSSFSSYSYLPSKQRLYFDPEITNTMPFALDLSDYFNQAKTRPRVANYNEISLIIQNEVHKALVKDQTPEEAIVNMNELLSKLK